MPLRRGAGYIDRVRLALTVSLAFVLANPPAARSEARNDRERPSCREALADLGVRFRPVRRKGIDIGVKIARGEIRGVEFRPYREGHLVIDCSLAYSLARAAELFRELGIERAVYSSAYDRRKIRGTDRLSHHSFGLAIDVHALTGSDLDERITLREDYEQGLGHDLDCVGDPLTEEGKILRELHCGLEASGLFRIVLSPDYDAHHYNHFHIEALPWEEREDVAGGEPSELSRR